MPLKAHLKVAKSYSARGLMLSLSLAFASSVVAFDELNDAQTLVYDTPHLSNTSEGQMIQYDYKNRTESAEPIEDSVSLSVAKAYDEGKRDVSVKFLTESRHLPLPDFKSFSGNPVIIATLEHIAQNLAQQSGGSVLYFRNRIRDALASDLEISQENTVLNEAEIETKVLRFKPFVDDPRVGRMPEFSNAEIELVFSEAVAGGVVSVGVESTYNNDFFYSQAISIK